MKTYLVARLFRDFSLGSDIQSNTSRRNWQFTNHARELV